MQNKEEPSNESKSSRASTYTMSPVDSKRYDVNDVIAKAEEKGIPMSSQEQLQLALLLGAGDTGIKEFDMEKNASRIVKIDNEALREFMEE